MKTLFLASATMACGLALATPASSAAYNFVTLSVPGATPGNYLAVSGLNDLGQAIVTEEEPNVSFDFTTIDDVYNWHTNTYTPLPAYPGSTPNSTQSFDINNAGVVVGDYHATGIVWSGFTLSGGSFTPVIYPAGSPYSYPIGISNNGDLAGLWVDDSGNLHGYVRIGSTFTSLDVPASWGNETSGSAINNAGTAVGIYSPPGESSNDFGTEPFLWSGGSFSQGALPAGYAYGVYNDINDHGVIVGTATNDPVNGTGSVSFVDVGGIFSLISDPLGVGGTSVYGINNEGVLGGEYVDADGNEQAFLAFPVSEPGALGLLGAGVIGLVLVRRRVVRTNEGLSRTA